MRDTAFAAIVIMVIWAIWIVALSRWKYWLSFLASIGCYVGAFVLIREIGFAAVAIAWATMSASAALIDVAFDRKPNADKTVSPVARAIAAFIVGLIGWPLVFPGTRYPPKSAAAAIAIEPSISSAPSRAKPDPIEAVRDEPASTSPAAFIVTIAGDRNEAYRRAALLAAENAGAVLVIDSLAGLAL